MPEGAVTYLRQHKYSPGIDIMCLQQDATQCWISEMEESQWLEEVTGFFNLIEIEERIPFKARN
jgi:hypothetical protein